MSSKLRRRFRRARAQESADSWWTRYRVAVCVPTQDMCHSAFMVSLVQMFTQTMVHAPGLAMLFLSYGTSILPFSRNVLAKQALERDATHLLWLDSDMTFPPDLAMALLRHRLPIVAANCMARRPPYAMTARIGDAQVLTSADSTGLVCVDRAGTGAMLVNAEVFKKLPMPWFEHEYLPDLGVFRGEDFVFCRKATEAGFEIHIDHDVSKQVEHIGQFGLNPLMKARMPAMEGSQ